MPKLSEGADRVGGQLRGDKECPFSNVTKSGRVWRKVPENGARSVGVVVVMMMMMMMMMLNRRWLQTFQRLGIPGPKPQAIVGNLSLFKNKVGALVLHSVHLSGGCVCVCVCVSLCVCVCCE